MRITLTALPIKSAGRFWPFGPLGIKSLFSEGAAKETLWHPPQGSLRLSQAAIPPQRSLRSKG
jgi:hypothetical protein